MTYSLLLILLASVACVLGHGRVLSPAGRSTAWRLGYNTTANFNDAGNFCGGFYKHYIRNHGKCGICGDSYEQPTPRDNELGGKYGSGLIVASYKPGTIFTAVIQVTAYHKGYWEFKLCPDPKRNDQECFDEYILELQNGGGTKFYPTEGEALYYVDYRLPFGLICEHCVLQWKYIAGNNYGNCNNGTGAIGCGKQEHFLACSDIKIDISATTNHGENHSTINYSRLNFMPGRIKQSFATEKYPHTPNLKDDKQVINEIKLNTLSEHTNHIVAAVSNVDDHVEEDDYEYVDDKTPNFSSEESENDEGVADDSKANFSFEDLEDVYDLVEQTNENSISDEKPNSSLKALQDVKAKRKPSDNQNYKKSCDSTQQCSKDVSVSKKQSHDLNIVEDQNIETTYQLSPDFLKNMPYVCVPYVKWALLESLHR